MSAVMTKNKRERQPASQASARHSGEGRNPSTSSFRTPHSGDPESNFPVSPGTVALVPLGEVVDINPRFGKDKLADDMPASFVPMKCVEEESGRFAPLEDRKVGDVRKGYTSFRDGDVIFAKVTPCMENGKAAVLSGLTNGVGFGSTEFFVLRPSKRIDPKYLLHFILQQSFRKEAARNMTGAVGLRRVPKSWFEQQRIPLPPVAAQRQIIAEIEKQFTRLDAGVAALRRVQANLKRYRAAVLKAACEGRLVPTEAEFAKAEGRTYETGEQLLARILADRRKNWHGRGKYKEPTAPDAANLPRFPEGWCTASVDQLCGHITSGSRDWSQFYGRGTGTFILAQNVRPMRLDLTERQAVDAPEGDAETERTRVRRDDILVTIVGAKTGDVCRIPVDLDEHFVCQSVAIIRPLVPESAKFIEMYLASQENGQEQWKRYIYGQGRPHLSFEQLKVTAIQLPPLAEQVRIVAEVERRLSVVEELEVAVAANLQRAARLRQAILQRAFVGCGP